MPTYNAIALVLDFLISTGVVFLVYTLLAKHLRELLDKVVRIPEGTAFYMRALVLTMLCLVLSSTVLTGIHEKPDAHFLEYVWAVSGHLSTVLENLFTLLLVYVGVVTILVVVLVRKNEQ